MKCKYCDKIKKIKNRNLKLVEIKLEHTFHDEEPSENQMVTYYSYTELLNYCPLCGNKVWKEEN